MFYWTRVIKALAYYGLILTNLILSLNLVMVKFRPSQIDPQLQFWVDEFGRVGLEHGVKVSTHGLIMRFVDRSSFGGEHELLGQKVVTLAQCNPMTNTIEIGREPYQNATEWQRRLVLFHEMGHCILKLGHDERIAANGMPNSIMYPIMTPIQYNPATAFQYDAQLFGSYAFNQGGSK
jgi:hypothetical protein